MKTKYTLISLSIFTALYSQAGFADLREQCLLGVPKFTGEPVQGSINDQPVYIEADDALINQPTSAVYRGNVDLKQGTRHLVADSVEVTQQGDANNLQRIARLQGGFDFKDDQINLKGQDAEFNLNSRDGNVTGADYQLVGRQGRGTAQDIELRNNYRLFKNATFTSCLPGDNA